MSQKNPSLKETKELFRLYKHLLIKYRMVVFALVFIIGIALNRFAAMQEGTLWGILRDLGIFLAASVAIPFVYDLFLKEEERGIFKQELTSLLDSEINVLIPRLRQYGLVGFHKVMDFRSLFETLDAGYELLWLDTYCPKFKDFLSNLERAIEKGASIRMLVINPKSENARYRAQEIKNTAFAPEIFCEDIKNFIRQIKFCVNQKNHKLRGKLEIRFYSNLPCIPMYIILDARKPDKKKFVCGYTSFYLTEPTSDFVHLEWNAAEKGLLKYFHKYFEQKWKAQRNNIIYKVPK